MAKEETYEAIDSLPLPLSSFVDKYSDRLPQIIAISESMYGICSGAFTEGQLLQVYFVKKTKAITTSIGSLKIIIPVNSTLRVTIPYHSPHLSGSATKDIAHSVFPTVSDLLKAKPIPSLVYVSKTCKGSGITKGQILVIKGVEEYSKKKKRLICVDVSTNVKLCLEESCKGNFTTQPSLTSITISTLLEHFQLPVNVIFQENQTCPNLSSKSGKFVRELELVSIMASFCDSHGSQGKKAVCTIPDELIEIVSTVAIDVRIIHLTQENLLNFKITRDTLGKRLTPSYISEVITNSLATQSSSKLLQKQILTSTMPDKEWKNDIIGIDYSNYESVCLLGQQELDYVEMKPELMLTDSTKLSSDGEVEKNDGQSFGPPPPIPPRTLRTNSQTPPVLPKRISTASRNRSSTVSSTSQSPPPVFSSSPLSSPLRKKKTMSFDVPNDTTELPSPLHDNEVFQSNQDNNLLSELKESNTKLLDRIHELEKTMKSSSTATVDDDDTKTSTRKANKTIIEQYTVNEVLSLLDKMSLSKYKDRFEEEQIDGSMFCELDDSILETDLGISMRLHRIKLMSIIDGRHSVQKYLT